MNMRHQAKKVSEKSFLVEDELFRCGFVTLKISVSLELTKKRVGVEVEKS